MKKSILIYFILFLMNQTIHAQEASNKHFWHSVTTTASSEAIWEIWTDVGQWKSWDSGLQDASVEGPFELNAKGMILSLEGRKSKFQVVAFDPGKSYTFKTNLPLGGLYLKRILSEEAGITTFTHEVWFKGLTGGLICEILWSEIQGDVTKGDGKDQGPGRTTLNQVFLRTSNG